MKTPFRLENICVDTFAQNFGQCCSSLSKFSFVIFSCAEEKNSVPVGIRQNNMRFVLFSLSDCSSSHGSPAGAAASVVRTRTAAFSVARHGAAGEGRLAGRADPTPAAASLGGGRRSGEAVRPPDQGGRSRDADQATVRGAGRSEEVPCAGNERKIFHEVWEWNLKMTLKTSGKKKMKKKKKKKNITKNRQFPDEVTHFTGVFTDTFENTFRG